METLVVHPEEEVLGEDTPSVLAETQVVKAAMAVLSLFLIVPFLS